MTTRTRKLSNGQRSTKEIKKQKTEKLARLKTQKKEIESEIKELEKEIKENYNVAEAETPDGRLKLEERKNYEIPDNLTLINKSTITKDVFIQLAKIAPSELKKTLGNDQFSDLLKKEVIKEKEPTTFYKLISKKE